MTPSEIAETLINGNISDARESFGDEYDVAAAVLALDVLNELLAECVDIPDIVTMTFRLRRCLTGGT